jgi:hypothetical protein
LTAIWFPPGGSGRKIGIQIRKGQLYKKGDKIHNTKTHNTQNIKQTHKTKTPKIKKNIKKHKVIRIITNRSK